MQFSCLRNLVTKEADGSGNETITMPASLFRQLLASALKSNGMFDETFYTAHNSDVSEAIRKNTIMGGASHYFTTGYFEDRLPCKLLVDERFYLESNADVAAAIRKGLVKSAQEHFEYTGFKEGRAPYKNFSLF
jgi:hypothetical protein